MKLQNYDYIKKNCDSSTDRGLRGRAFQNLQQSFADAKIHRKPVQEGNTAKPEEKKNNSMPVVAYLVGTKKHAAKKEKVSHIHKAVERKRGEQSTEEWKKTVHSIEYPMWKMLKNRITQGQNKGWGRG